MFLEDGHKHAGDAILRASNYKADTEPAQVPPEATLNQWLDDPIRTEFMRIGAIGLVPKTTTLPVQAADLYTYLISNLLRPTGHFVFQESFGKLAGTKPHWYSAWNSQKVKLLVSLIEHGQEAGAEQQGRVWKTCGALRALGLKAYSIPGALAIDARERKVSVSEERWRKIFEVNGLPAPEVE